MGLHKLERLHEAKGFLDTAAHWQVIYAHVLHHAIRVDDKQAPVDKKMYEKSYKPNSECLYNTIKQELEHRKWLTFRLHEKKKKAAVTTAT